MQSKQLGQVETMDAEVRVVGLKTNDDAGLACTAFRAPLLSWRLKAARRNVVQAAYELERCASPDFTGPVISDGRQEASAPWATGWPGAALCSREVAWCRVRVWTDSGVSAWSEPLRIEGTLFHADDWLGRPISPSFNVALAEPAAIALLRRAFSVPRAIATARLFVSALGLQECWINGAAVSPDLLEPGWTAYRDRLAFAAYDVTELISEGENVISAAVGDGWWRGYLTWTGKRSVYGDTTALLAQLELIYADGSREVIATDQQWRGGTGALLQSDLYDGCSMDLSRAVPGWQHAGFDEAGWSDVVVVPLPAGLRQRSLPPVREISQRPVAITFQTDRIVRVDCGQNLTGYLRIWVKASCTSRISVRHAEVLEEDGQLHTAALRGAKATEQYDFPPGEHVLSPKFTFHGFRYADVSLGEGVTIDRIEACVVASNLRQIGHFGCSDARVNQLYSNIQWSQRGNFLSIPTDCPQRDERLGWTGDIQVFAPTACANFDSNAFLTSWLLDLAFEQAPDGQVPSVVPNVIHGHEYEFGGVGWGDAATLVPWALYEAYGNMSVLAQQFSSMRKWIDWGASRLNGHSIWQGDFHLGDWLDPGAPPDRPEQATTDRDYIASAYLSFSAAKLSRCAEVLGEIELAAHYAALSRRVAHATWHNWRDAALTTQAGCAIAVAFDVAPQAEKSEIGAKLASLIHRSGGRVATGFLGTPLVLPALTATGQHDAAYRLLLNEDAPGWLYQVKSGATTMWERWDAVLPDGSINHGAMAAEDAETMTSFNHYAYGCIGSWLYRTVAGIAPDQDCPGYQHIILSPQPGGGLSWAEAQIDTPLGPAGIRWDQRDQTLVIKCRVPPAAHATFQAPVSWTFLDGQTERRFGSGDHCFELVMTLHETEASDAINL